MEEEHMLMRLVKTFLNLIYCQIVIYVSKLLNASSLLTLKEVCLLSMLLLQRKLRKRKRQQLQQMLKYIHVIVCFIGHRSRLWLRLVILSCRLFAIRVE